MINPPTAEVFAKEVDSWVNMLWNEVPENMLMVMFRAAYKAHKPGWPMECAEVLVAYKVHKAQQDKTGTAESQCSFCELRAGTCPFHGPNARAHTSRWRTSSNCDTEEKLLASFDQ